MIPLNDDGTVGHADLCLCLNLSFFFFLQASTLPTCYFFLEK